MQLYVSTPGSNPHDPISRANITARRGNDDRVVLIVESPDDDWQHLAPWWEKFYTELDRRGLLAKTATQDSANARTRREKTQARDNIIKKIKDEHPQWSRVKVAHEAQKQTDEKFTEDDVSNAYKRNKWRWERSDRIR